MHSLRTVLRTLHCGYIWTPVGDTHVLHAYIKDASQLGLQMTLFARILSLPVRAYRIIFSPWVGFNCRFQPTCSAYALEALEKHGAIKGSWLAARRIGRCHPFGSDGYDPVPEPKSPKDP